MLPQHEIHLQCSVFLLLFNSHSLALSVSVRLLARMSVPWLLLFLPFKLSANMWKNLLRQLHGHSLMAFNLHSIIGTMTISVPFLSHLNACSPPNHYVGYACACRYLLIELFISMPSGTSNQNFHWFHFYTYFTRNTTKIKRKLTKRRSKRFLEKEKRRFQFFKRNIVVGNQLAIWFFMCNTQHTMFCNVSPPRNCFNKKKNRNSTLPITMCL